MILIFAIFIVILNAVIYPIIVENCKWGPTYYILVHQNQATKGNVKFTYFTICKSLNNKLVIDYFNVDSFIDAPLNKCNDLQWQHDVDEFYIGTKKEYYVINVSPNGALAYSTKINPNGNCSDIITTYRQCDEISYFAEFFTPTAWNAHIELPISMFTQYIYQFLQSKQDEGQLNSLYELQSYQFITCLLPQTRQIHLIDSVKYKLNHQIYIIQYYVKFISRPYLFVNSQISTIFVLRLNSEINPQLSPKSILIPNQNNHMNLTFQISKNNFQLLYSRQSYRNCNFIVIKVQFNGQKTSVVLCDNFNTENIWLQRNLQNVSWTY